MYLPIHPDLSLQDIQSAFRKSYPNLKIEFFKTLHDNHESSHAKHLLDHHLMIRKFSKKEAFELDISGHRTVAELEKDIQDHLGISAQVFRLAHDIWIETTETDDWTLDHQNQQAEDLKNLHSHKTLEQRIEDARFDQD